MFSFVFQSHISLDCDEGIPPSDAKVIPPSDVKVIPPSDVKVIPPSDVKIPPSDVKVILSSDAKEVESDGVVNSQQEKQVLCDLLCVTVQELCDCPRVV